MTKILEKLKWIFFALAILVVEQGATAFLREGMPLGESLLLSLVFLLIAVVTWLLAKRWGLLEGLTVLKNGRAWKSIFLYFLLMTLVKMVGGIVLTLQHGDTANTVNQAAIDSLNMVPILLIILTSITAPVVEETVMRGLIQGKVFNNSLLGVIAGGLLFGALHVPTDLGSWIIYAGMGMVLGLAYYRSQKLEYSIGLHFLNNFLSVILTLLVM